MPDHRRHPDDANLTIGAQTDFLTADYIGFQRFRTLHGRAESFVRRRTTPSAEKWSPNWPGEDHYQFVIENGRTVDTHGTAVLLLT